MSIGGTFAQNKPNFVAHGTMFGSSSALSWHLCDSAVRPWAAWHKDRWP